MKITVKRWLLTAAILAALFCSSVQVADAQIDLKPWDFNITGVVTGLARITFVDDGTLSGYLIVRPTPHINPINLPTVVAYGFTTFDGEWSFDGNGHLIGFFGGGSSELPLNMSFSGKLSTTAMSLKAKGSDGSWRMRGIQEDADSSFDLTSWSATILTGTQKSFEFFDMSAFFVCLDDPPPADLSTCVNKDYKDNLFFIFGSTAGSDTIGAALVGQNRIALIIENITTGVDRVETGTIKPGPPRASIGMKGLDTDNPNARMSIVEQP
jgi:hypothetical protein